jgi:hypothetical protein
MLSTIVTEMGQDLTTNLERDVFWRKAMKPWLRTAAKITQYLMLSLPHEYSDSILIPFINGLLSSMIVSHGVFLKTCCFSTTL